MLAILLALLVPPLTGGIRIGEADDQRWVRYVDAAGLDTVQVTVYADQVRWDGPEVDFYGQSWKDYPGLVAEVAAARSRSLRVMLVLRVKLDRVTTPHNRHLWHGMIWPATDQLAEWFAQYRIFVLFWARHAHFLGIDALMIGHELNSMTSTTAGPHLPDLLAYHLDAQRTGEVIKTRLACAKGASAPWLTSKDGHRYGSLAEMLAAEDAVHRRWAARATGLTPGPMQAGIPRPPTLARRRAELDRRWRALIADVRAIYPGPVGYGANFDQFDEVGFWNALDFIGISSYFALRTLDVPDEQLPQALSMGWAEVIERIEAVAQQVKRPVVLHELGWSRKLGSTIRPYSFSGVEPIEAQGGLTCIDWHTQPDAPLERDQALAALVDHVEAGRFPSLRGVSFWKLTTEPVHRAVEAFAVLLPPPYVDRVADHGFMALAGRLARAIEAQTLR
jgi:hypothetical protein